MKKRNKTIAILGRLLSGESVKQIAYEEDVSLQAVYYHVDNADDFPLFKWACKRASRKAQEK